MSQVIPIYIPTYISDQNYNPTRVLPRLFFYNGLVECEEYWIESGSLTNSGVTFAQNHFPYFDNYNVVSGSFPTIDSDSLLFNNEAASYGEIPVSNLYTKYWETYVNLLYNPVTRLFNCEAIIPLSDYYKMELNDIVEWRGNYYYLRAINEYNLSNGECKIQLLGPLEPPVISGLLPELECGFAFTSSLIVTTTTTSGPTTTTTTTLAPCVTTVSFDVVSQGEVTYLTCCGALQYQFFYTGPQTINVCMQNASLTAAGAVISNVVYGTTSCPCIPLTKYLVRPCGGGTSFIITRASGDIPTTVGQAFKIDGASGAGFNGITCWEILEIDPVGSAVYSLAFGTAFINCSTCNPTTTTTTTSTTTTTTTTIAPTTTTTTTGAPVEYQIDNGASGTSALACASATTTSLVYAQPGFTVPFVGMILYDSTSLTTPFVGSAGWRKLTGPLDTYAVEIDVNGEITNYITC
jgi:hypothetical protein